jgi:hypothetical protein
MKNRDEFVNHLKARLDRWNDQAAKWEETAHRVRTTHLAAFDARREDALYQLKLLERASTEAYEDAVVGAENAWKALAEAFDTARSHFEKAPSKKKA